jgi:hypothetical protein
MEVRPPLPCPSLSRPSLPRKVTGFSLLVLGVLGTVLPILQGGLFIALGLFVLRDQYGWAHRAMEWARARWPGAMGKVEGMEARLVAWAARQGRRLRRLLPAGQGAAPVPSPVGTAAVPPRIADGDPGRAGGGGVPAGRRPGPGRRRIRPGTARR